LIEAGADLTITDTVARGALHYACEKKRFEVVKLLIEKGIEFKAYNSRYSPIQEAAFVGKFLWLFLKKGKKKVSCVIFPLLFFSLHLGSIECVEILHNAGCDLNDGGFNNMTVPLIAAKQGHLDVLQYCIQMPAMMNKWQQHKTAQEGYSCLTLAIRNG
jgi:ankyrin repeat protein